MHDQDGEAGSRPDPLTPALARVTETEGLRAPPSGMRRSDGTGRDPTLRPAHGRETDPTEHRRLALRDSAVMDQGTALRAVRPAVREKCRLI